MNKREARPSSLSIQFKKTKSSLKTIKASVLIPHKRNILINFETILKLISDSFQREIRIGSILLIFLREEDEMFLNRMHWVAVK